MYVVNFSNIWTVFINQTDAFWYYGIMFNLSRVAYKKTYLLFDKLAN